MEVSGGCDCQLFLIHLQLSSVIMFHVTYFVSCVAR